MTGLENEPPLLFAFRVRDGRAQTCSFEEIRSSGAPAPSGYVWAALNRHKEEARDWLRRESGLPALAAQALLAEETRPRTLKIGAGAVVILRGVNLNPGESPEDMVSVRLWIDAEKVISVHLRRLKAVTDLRRQFERNEAPPESPGAFLATLANRLVDRMEPVIDDYRDKIDTLEEESIDSPDRDMRARLGALRREAIILRRYIAPQRDLLNAQSADPSNGYEEKTRLEMRETSDRITRLVEELDAVRDRASVVSDQLVDQRAEEMNRNMLILSVVAAIFLPLGFLTGLLGINVGGMPGENDPAAFWWVVLASVTIGGGLLVWFSRKGWL